MPRAGTRHPILGTRHLLAKLRASARRWDAAGSGARDADEVLDREFLAACGRGHPGALEDLARRGGRTAEHVRQGLAEHLAPLLERRVDDREGAQALLFRAAGLGIPFEADEHA